jgi:hypothetical protein
MKNFILALFAFVAAASVSCTGPGEDWINRATVQGTWQDRFDPDQGYFDGSTCTLTFENNSFFLEIYWSTDAGPIGDTCFSYAFTRYMQGRFSIDLQDIITLEGIYVDSLKRALPPCGCAYGPRKSGKYLASFSAKLEDDVLYLKDLSPQARNYPVWVLKRE